MVFLMQFRLFRKKQGVSLIENHQEMASRYYLRQLRDLLVYELHHLDREIGRLGGFMRYYHLKAIGGNVRQLEPLIQRRAIVLTEIRRIEPQIGLNVYTI